MGVEDEFNRLLNRYLDISKEIQNLTGHHPWSAHKFNIVDKFVDAAEGSCADMEKLLPTLRKAVQDEEKYLTHIKVAKGS